MSSWTIFLFVGTLGSASGPNSPSPLSDLVGLTSTAVTAALATPLKVSSNSKLVELEMPEFRDCRRTSISILTAAADHPLEKVA